MSTATVDATADAPSLKPNHGRTAFVYGTLMVPQILHRVCHRVERPHPELISHLRFTPALLRNYSRRKVRFADYPGITPQTSHTVLGTLISGLSDTDVKRLDVFEGHMYERVVVEVEALEAEVFDRDGNINEEIMEKVKTTKEGERKMVKAETYVWCLGEDDLETEEWSFADFRREKMKHWLYGPQNDDPNDKYDDTNWGVEDDQDEGEISEATSAGGEDKVEEKDEEGDEEGDEEVEKRRIASVVAGIAAEEAEAGADSEALRSVV